MDMVGKDTSTLNVLFSGNNLRPGDVENEVPGCGIGSELTRFIRRCLLKILLLPTTKKIPQCFCYTVWVVIAVAAREVCNFVTQRQNSSATLCNAFAFLIVTVPRVCETKFRCSKSFRIRLTTSREDPISVAISKCVFRISFLFPLSK